MLGPSLPVSASVGQGLHADLVGFDDDAGEVDVALGRGIYDRLVEEARRLP